MNVYKITYSTGGEERYFINVLAKDFWKAAQFAKKEYYSEYDEVLSIELIASDVEKI